MIKLSDIEIVPLTNIKGDDSSSMLNPMHTASEYTSLLEDIRLNGQMQPIIVCRDLIIDGRNRFRALIKLGITDVLIQSMPYKSSRLEKEKMAKSSEVARRHQSKTQLACKAVGDWNSNIVKHKQDGLTQLEFILVNNTNNKNFSLANYIYKHNKSMFDALLNGNSVNIDKNNLNKLTSSLTAIVAHLKHQDSEFKREIEDKEQSYEPSTGERLSDAEDAKKRYEYDALVKSTRVNLEIVAKSMDIPFEDFIKSVYDSRKDK